MARSRKPQPRAISSEVVLLPTVYRGGLYAELQKFGDKDRDRSVQLTLLPEEEPEELTFSSGLDLTVSEDKALSALQILLDRTDYQGQATSQPQYGGAFRWDEPLPVLMIRHSDYFQAYGLERKGDGSFYGHQAEEALEALRGLASKPRAVYYQRKHRKGEKVLTDIIKARSPLIKLTELTAYQDLDEDEASQVLAGEDLPKKIRANGLRVEISPLLVDSLDSFHILKPTRLHREIQDQVGGKRVSRAISLFIEWLLTKNAPKVKISESLLIQKLRLESYVQSRHREQAVARIQEAIKVAVDLGFLLDWEEEVSGMLSFRLNPERCSRVKGKKEETEG